MTTPPPAVTLNPNARIEVRTMGRERQPLLIVDCAVNDPDALFEFAALAQFMSPAEGSHYPGLNAHLPSSYLPAFMATLDGPMTELFGMPPGSRPTSFGFFGLATAPAGGLSARQAVPHTDSHKINSLATVHFLGGSQFGGTAFYRHKATGYELIRTVLSHPFKTARDQELAAYESRPDEALSDLYEEIAYVEPVYNRLIMYRAAQLHSAKLENAAGLNSDPRTGRLTANLSINTV